MTYEIRKHRLEFKQKQDIFEGCSILDTELGELVGTYSSLREALQELNTLSSICWREGTCYGFVYIVEEYAIHQVDKEGKQVEMLNHHTSSLPTALYNSLRG